MPTAERWVSVDEVCPPKLVNEILDLLPPEIWSDIIDKYKVFLPPLGSGSDSFPHPILGKPSKNEIAFIESMIRPMEAGDE